MQDRHSTDPTQEVLDHADCTASTRQHELDHTDHTDHTDQESISPEGLDDRMRIGDLSVPCGQANLVGVMV